MAVHASAIPQTTWNYEKNNVKTHLLFYTWYSEQMGPMVHMFFLTKPKLLFNFIEFERKG